MTVCEQEHNTCGGKPCSLPRTTNLTEVCVSDIIHEGEHAIKTNLIVGEGRAGCSLSCAVINVFLYECNAVTLRVQEMRAHSNLHLTKLRLHRRRREMVNRPAAPTGAASQSSAAAESEVLKQKKANETQQAVVLFIIVLASTYTSVSLRSGYFGRNSGTSFVRHLFRLSVTVVESVSDVYENV